MKQFLIKDEINAETLMTIEAANGKSALMKLRNQLTSSGMYEISKTKLGNWEMRSTYGRAFYAVEKKGLIK